MKIGITRFDAAAAAPGGAGVPDAGRLVLNDVVGRGRGTV
jgi:hypothetical protein